MDTQKSLHVSEWLVVGSFLILLISFATVTCLHEHRKASVLQNASRYATKPILIQISGAVQKPGAYSVPSGTTLREVLKKSRPKKTANLQALPLDQPMTKPIDVAVPELSSITVHIEGAVAEPIELVLPIGSRICDLKPNLSLLKQADRTFFYRKKVLKDGEVILIPEKPAKNPQRINRPLGFERGSNN